MFTLNTINYINLFVWLARVKQSFVSDGVECLFNIVIPKTIENTPDEPQEI